LKLRTFDGKPVLGELTTEYPVSQDGLPVLMVNDEPFPPEEAEYFIEYANTRELKLLNEGGGRERKDTKKSKKLIRMIIEK